MNTFNAQGYKQDLASLVVFSEGLLHHSAPSMRTPSGNELAINIDEILNNAIKKVNDLLEDSIFAFEGE